MLKTKQLGREEVCTLPSLLYLTSFTITCIWKIMLHYRRYLDDRGLRNAWVYFTSDKEMRIFFVDGWIVIFQSF